MTAVISPHTAIIYLMVTASAADGDMTDGELRLIGTIVRSLPVFRGFNEEQLVRVSQECAAIMSERDGLQTIIGLARQALPDRLRETAFACAVEVAAADDRINQEELRVLELIRSGLHVDRLAAAAIERAAAARHAHI